LSISGNDAQTVQRKFKRAWHGQLQVRFIILTNELPNFADPTGVIGTRFMVLEFRTSFLGREDPHLIHKLLREASGILNLAIEGYARLRERKRFEQPNSAKQMAKALSTTPIKEFIADRCKLDRKKRVKASELYGEYRIWCEANGYKPNDAAQFGQGLRREAQVKSQRPRKDNPHRERFYVGIEVGF
jgi:putative DNA primase/helicase